MILASCGTIASLVKGRGTNAMRWWRDSSKALLYFAALFSAQMIRRIMRRVTFGRPKVTKKAPKVCLGNPNEPKVLCAAVLRHCLLHIAERHIGRSLQVLVPLILFIKPRFTSRLRRLRRVLAPGPTNARRLIQSCQNAR